MTRNDELNRRCANYYRRNDRKDWAETKAERLERRESFRGRTTPEIEWRVWNKDHTRYATYNSKREALANLAIDVQTET
jgi:hypothetical protein